MKIPGVVTKNNGVVRHGARAPWSLGIHANFADLTPDGFHFWMTLSPRTSEPVRPWSKILATPLTKNDTYELLGAVR